METLQLLLFPRVCFVQQVFPEATPICLWDYFFSSTRTQENTTTYKPRNSSFAFLGFAWIFATFKRLVQSTILYFNMECFGMLLWNSLFCPKIVHQRLLVARSD